jgi:hypothetical protein
MNCLLNSMGEIVTCRTTGTPNSGVGRDIFDINRWIIVLKIESEIAVRS